MTLFFVLFFVFSKNVCESFPLQCSWDYCIPRVVWSYWSDATKLSEDVEEMIAVTRKSLENFTYYLLTADNATDYVEYESIPDILSALKAQCQSDYIRVCVLQKYGGVYVDATTYVTSEDGMDWVFKEALKAKLGVFGFRKGEVPSLIECSFIGAPKNSVFMKRFKDEYDTVLNGNIKQYVSQSCATLKGKTGYSWAHECGTPYFLMHHIFLMLCENETLRSDVLLWPWQISQIALSTECDSKADCFVNRLLHDPKARSMHFIKVPNYLRTGKKFNMHTIYKH